MPKFFLTFILVFVLLLAGCVNSAPKKESFLDEKIKCAKLADEWFKKKEKGYPGSNYLFVSEYSNYSIELDTCVVSYIIEKNVIDKPFGMTRRIVDILLDKVLLELRDSLPDEIYGEEKKKFDQKFKKYFGEDAQ